MNRFGNFLKKEIARNKLSQNKFAKEIGVSSYYVGQLIKGEKDHLVENYKLKLQMY